MNVFDLLNDLKDLLIMEKEYIVKAINDGTATQKLNEIVEKKQEVLTNLAKFNVEDFKNYKEIIKEIQILSENNMFLAQSNLKFIESVFESIFEETSTYSSEGEVKKQPSSILNKKV